MKNIKVKEMPEKTYCKYCGEETNGAYCCLSCFKIFEGE